MDIQDLHQRFFRYILGLTSISLVLLGTIFLWPQTKSRPPVQTVLSEAETAGPEAAEAPRVAPLQEVQNKVRNFFEWREPRPGGVWIDEMRFVHEKVPTSVFWVGQETVHLNGKSLSYAMSAWDKAWIESYGGIDAPENRVAPDYFPAQFEPKENPYYVAIPYNDFDDEGLRKEKAFQYVPWAGEKKWADKESMVKNHWVKIEKGDRVAFAQWQDAGPNGENEVVAVFGPLPEKNKGFKQPAIALSPDVASYLGLKPVDQVEWEFVPTKEVGDGPWKKIVTTSNGNW